MKLNRQHTAYPADGDMTVLGSRDERERFPEGGGVLSIEFQKEKEG